MTLHRGLLNWGVFLIVLAAVPLAVQWGYLDAAAAGELLRLWPLILIAIGVGLMLRVTPFSLVGGVLAAATLGLLGGALIVGGVGSIGGACIGDGRASGPLETRTGPLTGPSARVDLELTCVDLDVARSPGPEWRVEADFSGNNPPRLDAAADRLSLSSPSERAFFGGQARRDVNVVLPQDPALSMSVTLNAARGTIRLGGGELSSLSGTFNASDVRLELAGALAQASSTNLTLNASSGTLALPAASMRAGVTLNAAALDVCVAPDAGLRIDYDARASGENFAQAGLVRTGDTWQTPGYDTAGVQTELRISSNASSVTLHRTGDCP